MNITLLIKGMKYDEKRTEYLDALRIRVLRFENHEVFQSPEEVLLEIKRNFRMGVDEA